MNVRSTLLSTAAALGLLMSAGLAPTLAHAQAPAAQVIPSDARTALSGGLHDAGQYASGMALEYSVQPAPGFYDPDALFAPPQNAAEAEAFRARMAANPKYGP
ncbi:MAG: hypothetical protein ACXW3K_03785, partial [Brevundimonas sp.]